MVDNRPWRRMGKCGDAYQEILPKHRQEIQNKQKTLCFFPRMQGCILQKLHNIYCQLSTEMFFHIRVLRPTSPRLIYKFSHIWRLNSVAYPSLVLPQWKMQFMHSFKIRRHSCAMPQCPNLPHGTINVPI